LRVNVLDLKCHPHDYKVSIKIKIYKVLAACTDGFVRIWNYTTFTELNCVSEEGIDAGTSPFTTLSFQADG